MSGWTVLVVDDNVAERVLADQPGLPIVLFTAVLDDATQQAADELGIAACITQDDLQQLPDTLTSLLG
jgi:hypothetical protein